MGNEVEQECHTCGGLSAFYLIYIGRTKLCVAGYVCAIRRRMNVITGLCLTQKLILFFHKKLILFFLKLCKNILQKYWNFLCS